MAAGRGRSPAPAGGKETRPLPPALSDNDLRAGLPVDRVGLLTEVGQHVQMSQGVLVLQENRPTTQSDIPAPCHFPGYRGKASSAGIPDLFWVRDPSPPFDKLERFMNHPPNAPVVGRAAPESTSPGEASWCRARRPRSLRNPAPPRPPASFLGASFREGQWVRKTGGKGTRR